ncbi:MAG: sigma-54-dependent transcriptional regulator [Planctomycetaceae bacterium]
MPALLIIDDEPNVRYSLEKGLRRDGLSIVMAETARDGLARASQQDFDAILLDVQLPDLSGLEALNRLRQHSHKTPVIIMTAHGTADTAIEAMKRGAFDYILKPWNLAVLRELVNKALEAGRLSRVPAVMDSEAPLADDAGDRIIGRSPVMQAVFKEIGRVAAQDVNVLILGESGTGKELAARATYHHSQRSQRPFLAINCAALPDSLLESELFGHEKGAFTGADRRRIGKFEQAHHGTLFLDEIGDMSPATQAKVLRVLQDGRFERVGGEETITTDVRILAATNRPLEEAIARQEFRQDLFYRLNTFTLTLPPLRERVSDIPLLSDYFLRRHRSKVTTDVQGVSAEAMQTMQAYRWPGNVRELESAIRYALVHAVGQQIQVHDLPAAVTGEASDHSPVVPNRRAASKPAESASSPGDWPELRTYLRELLSQGSSDLLARMHDATDRVLLEEVLREVGGHQSHAADRLGISRTTLRGRLQQLGLTIERSVQSEADGDG